MSTPSAEAGKANIATLSPIFDSSGTVDGRRIAGNLRVCTCSPVKYALESYGKSLNSARRTQTQPCMYTQPSMTRPRRPPSPSLGNENYVTLQHESPKEAVHPKPSSRYSTAVMGREHWARSTEAPWTRIQPSSKYRGCQGLHQTKIQRHTVTPWCFGCHRRLPGRPRRGRGFFARLCLIHFKKKVTSKPHT